MAMQEGGKPITIDDFNAIQASEDRQICDLLRQVIDESLPEADSRIWHAHPVWFLAGNPIVGYSKLKSCIRLLFWSGQSFDVQGLTPEGTFKAAEKRYTAFEQVNVEELKTWLEQARLIQWDYKNIVKKRRLDRIS